MTRKYFSALEALIASVRRYFFWLNIKNSLRPEHGRLIKKYIRKNFTSFFR